MLSKKILSGMQPDILAVKFSCQLLSLIHQQNAVAYFMIIELSLIFYFISNI